MSTNVSNGSYDDLVRLNDQRFVTLIPAVAIFSLYMLMGLVGNSLVCYIIGFKFQSNNQNFLIVWLAIFDLLSCLVAIPTDIVDMRFSYTFPSAIACKILRFIMAFTCMGSAFVLIVIAIDRHRKICKPLAPQMTRNQIKVALTIALSIAVCLAWPAPVVFGLRVYESPIKGQKAKDCSTSNEMKDTIFPTIYTGVLFLSFVVLCVVLITLYYTILITIKRHGREMRAMLKASPKRTQNLSESDLTSLSVDATVAQVNKGAKKNIDDLTIKVENSDVDKNTSANVSDSSFKNIKHSESKQMNAGNGEDMEDRLDLEKERSGSVQEGFVKPGQKNRQEENESCFKDSEEKNAQTKNLEDVLISNVNVKFQSDAMCADGIPERKLNVVCQNEMGDVKQESEISTSTTAQQSSDGKSSVDSATPIVSDRYKNKRWLPRITSSKKKSPTSVKLEEKTTRIAFLITLVFILSFLPYLSLQIAKVIDEGFDYNLKGTAFLLQNIFLRSYYINSISNPIIYGVLNSRFRIEARRLFRKMLCCR